VSFSDDRERLNLRKAFLLKGVQNANGDRVFSMTVAEAE